LSACDSRYYFKIEHQPGRYNQADYLYRQPIMDDSDNTHERVEEHVNATAVTSIPNGLTQALIAEATKQDETLKLVAEMIRTGIVHKNDLIKPYESVRNELTITQHGIMYT
jgi:hypothetical protein